MSQTWQTWQVEQVRNWAWTCLFPNSFRNEEGGRCMDRSVQNDRYWEMANWISISIQLKWMSGKMLIRRALEILLSLHIQGNFSRSAGQLVVFKLMWTSWLPMALFPSWLSFWLGIKFIGTGAEEARWEAQAWDPAWESETPTKLAIIPRTCSLSPPSEPQICSEYPPSAKHS